MPINKEEKISRDLKKAKGIDPDKPKQESEPDIIRKPHPERKKMFIWVAIAAVLIGVVGIGGISLRMKYKKDNTFSEKYMELKQTWSESWSSFSDSMPGEENAENIDERKVISNPNNLSEEEIKNLEQKAFPEEDSSTDLE